MFPHENTRFILTYKKRISFQKLSLYIYQFIKFICKQNNCFIPQFSSIFFLSYLDKWAIPIVYIWHYMNISTKLRIIKNQKLLD